MIDTMPIMLVVGTEEELTNGRGQRAMTITQTAARLGVSERAVRILMQQKEVSPYPERLMNLVLFVENDVEELRDRRMLR